MTMNNNDLSETEAIPVYQHPDPAFSDRRLNEAETETLGRMTNPGTSPIGNQGPPHLPFVGPVIHRGQMPESHNSEDLWPTDSQ